MSDALFDLDAPGTVHRSAVVSPDGLYRYSLARWWDTSLPHDLWIMCNPSTADADLDDATIRRCIGFSKRLGSGGFVVVNAYAYRATKPTVMWAAAAAGLDIVGPRNDWWISERLATEAGSVILAWGAHPKPERCMAVSRLIDAAGRKAHCFGTTKDGRPRHPLMLPNDAPFHRWPVADLAAEVTA